MERAGRTQQPGPYSYRDTNIHLKVYILAKQLLFCIDALLCRMFFMSR
jgi:hypothetical protein